MQKKKRKHNLFIYFFYNGGFRCDASSNMFSESHINVDPAMRVKLSIHASGACVGVYVPVRVCVNQAAIVIPVLGGGREV